MKHFFYLLISIAVLSSLNVTADDDMKLHIGAYVDTYIATDNDHSGITNEEYHFFRQYAYIDGQKNNFGLNIAQISANMEYKDMLRGVITFHYGDIPIQAFAMPGLGKMLQEGYVGIRIIENLWVDAGFFLTHIGGEALLPKDNWLSSHSMVTYVEPFYHSGVRALYDNGTFSVGLHILNSGFSFIENNDNKTIGYNVGYSAGDIFSASFSGMFGNDISGGSANAKMNIYNNVNIESYPTKKLGLKAQFDLATHEDGYMNDGELESSVYFGFSLQGKYQILEQIAGVLRFEHFDDTKQYAGINASGIGITAAAEYQPTSFSYIRLEGRMLNFDDNEDSDGNQFQNADGELTNSRMEVMLNFGVFID